MAIDLGLYLLFFWGPLPPSLNLEGGLGLRLSSDLLHQPLVTQQLYSGLTTTFHVTCMPKPALEGFVESSFRLDIRYEPWDEIFQVTYWHSFDGRRQWDFNNFAALKRWWSEYSYPLRPDSGPNPSQKPGWLVVLEVIPFSHQEQEQAKEWLRVAESQGGQKPFDGRLEGPGEGDNDRGNSGILRAMLSTSIRREAILRYKWKLRPP